MTLRTALVTGASAGIGRELVRQLVRDRRMTVLATARRLDRLEALAAEFPPGCVRVRAGDLADSDFRARLWAEAEALPGGLDLLVNNAAFGHYAELADESPDTIRAMLEINLLAVIDLTRRALPHMKARGAGQIVQVSSTLGFVGLPCSATYVATKHAINGLVKSLAYELRGTGVRVWAACPNRTESEFFAVASNRPGQTIRSGFSEPTERVVRGIVRGLDRRRSFIFPTWPAWGIVQAASWFPAPFEWAMRRFALRQVQRELHDSAASP